MTATDDDSLDDPAMARLMRRFGTQVTRGAGAVLSPQRRAALQTALDAIDAEAVRRGRRIGRWRTWLVITAAAALLIVGVVLALGSPPAKLPELTVQVARAEPIRGAPAAFAFTVDVAPGEPGFARIDAYAADGKRRTLPLRDGQPVARVSGRTRFGEFDLADTWRILVVFAPTREALASPEARTPDLLAGTTAAERLSALARAVVELRRHDIAAIESAVP